MVRTSPRIRIATFLFVIIFSMTGFAQNSKGATTAQTQVGQSVQLEGELHIQYQDFKDRSRVSYTLKLPNGKTVPLHFMKNPPTQFLTGDHVQVNGQMSGGNLVLYSGSTNVKTSSKPSSGGSTTSSIPVPNTFGSQSTLVILVNFQDDAIEPYSVSDAQSLFSSTINDFFVENSYGQTTIVPTVVGWYTIPESITACNTSQIATDAQNAAVAAGVVLSNYNRYVYMFPYDTACGFAGMSDVGGKPSQSWINGTTGPGGNTLDPHVINHELGHAFGLWHSHRLDCSTASTVCSNGIVIEYGDVLDVMGAPGSSSADYNAFQKRQLGWLGYGSSPALQTVTSSGTYTIYPYETGGPGPNALRILQSTDATTGAKTWYYLESRQAIGFDSFLSNPVYYMENETAGVLFHLGTDGNGGSSELLDITPATPTSQNYYDMSLVAGQSYTDANAGVTITPTAVSGAGATVQITVNGTSSCTPGSPTVTVTPSQSQSVIPGTAVSFTATVKDNDSSGCPSSMFNLADVLPSGWGGTWNASSLSLSPGKSGSAALTVTSPSGTAGGLYSLGVNAINAVTPSDSGGATATYVVVTSGPLTVGVSTDQPSYLPGQTVSISVTVTSGTSPAAGVSVTSTITSPSGRLTTLKGTTGTGGVALLNYKLSKGASAGTYQIGATATSGTSTTSTVSATAVANVTFTVQ